MFETKREIFLFSIKDCLAIEEHFEDMAMDGWVLEEVGKFTVKYRRSQPMNLSFTADVYPELKFFKDSDNKDVERYIKKSEDSGWKYIGSYNNLQIFYSEKEEDLIPIQNDHKEKLEIIQRSLPVNLISLAFSILLLYLNLPNLSKPYYYENLYSNIGIIFPIMIVGFLFSSIMFLISDLLWLIRSRISGMGDKPIPRTNYAMAKIKGNITFTLLILLTIGLVAAIIGDTIVHSIPLYLVIIPIGLFIIILTIYNKWLKPKEIGGFQEFLLLLVTIIPIIFIPINRIEGYSEDNYSESLEAGYIGITAEELDIDDKVEEKTFTKEASILVPRKSVYTEYYEEGSVRTIYIKSRNPKIARYIFDKTIEDELRVFNNDITKDDGYDYFDEVYYISSGPSENYMADKITVLKDNIIIYLYGDIDLSDQKIIDMIINKIEENEDV